MRDPKLAQQNRDHLDAIYSAFNEEGRLLNRAGQIEFITTIKAIESVLSKDMTIIDVGAGTGTYSLYFAKQDYDVTALEPALPNFQKLESKVKEANLDNLEIHHLSSLDLRQFDDQSFDIVLLFGPLYHLADEDDRYFTLMEARRICKNGGHIFIATINHDMVAYREAVYNANFFHEDGYDHSTLRIKDDPFVFSTVDETRSILKAVNLRLQQVIATDGIAEILLNTLEDMDDYSFQQYLKLHEKNCKSPYFMGTSSHLLFHCRQKESIKMSYPWDTDVQEEIENFNNFPVFRAEFYNDLYLRDKELSLDLRYISPGVTSSDWAPAYYYNMVVDGTVVGLIDLRIGYSENLYYAGNIGYRVHEEYRGNSYAARACRLLRPLAQKHGMNTLCITNDYKNIASKRVCEKIGAKLMRLTMVPKGNAIRKEGQVFQNVYYWDL